MHLDIGYEEFHVLVRSLDHFYEFLFARIFDVALYVGQEVAEEVLACGLGSEGTFRFCSLGIYGRACIGRAALGKTW